MILAPIATNAVIPLMLTVIHSSLLGFTYLCTHAAPNDPLHTSTVLNPPETLLSSSAFVALHLSIPSPHPAFNYWAAWDYELY